MPVALPGLSDLLVVAGSRALHLELRDVYGASAAYTAWVERRLHDRSAADRQWADLLRPLREAGGDLRRARVVSEPVTDYIRYEYEVTPAANLAAGERVRWLPRRLASCIALPGNDFWLIDDQVVFNLFSGGGEWIGIDLANDPDTVRLCEAAFEAVWKLGIDHEQYQPR